MALVGKLADGVSISAPLLSSPSGIDQPGRRQVKISELEGIKVSSLCRKIRHVFTKFFYDAWVSAWKFFGSKLSLDSKTQRKLASASVRQKDMHYATPAASAVDALRQQKALNTSSVYAFCERMGAEIPGTRFISTYLIRGPATPILPDAVSDNVNLLIPVVIKGLFRDHIIAIFFDRRENRIEIYDPKGLTIMDRDSEHLYVDDNTTLPQLIAKLVSKYGNERTRVFENIVKHQYDSHNCGAYVCDYFRRRIDDDESPDHIQMNPVYDTTTIRMGLIKRILFGHHRLSAQE